MSTTTADTEDQYEPQGRVITSKGLKNLTEVEMSASMPVAVLTGLGILITVLGLFAAGEIALVAIGLGAVLAAAVIHAYESRRSD